MDSGIRGGADIFKALALGASAVLIGRPYVYGLALAGRAGVREVIQNLAADFDLTMGLAGCRAVAEIDADALVPTPDPGRASSAGPGGLMGTSAASSPPGARSRRRSSGSSWRSRSAMSRRSSPTSPAGSR